MGNVSFGHIQYQVAEKGNRNFLGTTSNTGSKLYCFYFYGVDLLGDWQEETEPA